MNFDVQLPPYTAWALLLALVVLWLTHRLTIARTPKKKARLVPRLVTRRVVRGGRETDDYALIVRNDGEAAARLFELRFLLAEGQKSPVWDSDRDPTDRITVPIIHPGQTFEWLAVFYFRAPTEFDAMWSWSEERQQRREERRGTVKLEQIVT